MKNMYRREAALQTTDKAGLGSILQEEASMPLTSSKEAIVSLRALSYPCAVTKKKLAT
jgi:hypothetical protein